MFQSFIYLLIIIYKARANTGQKSKVKGQGIVQEVVTVMRENFDLKKFSRQKSNGTSRLILFRHDPNDPALVDARRWLEREIWPHIQTFNPQAELKIIENLSGDQLLAEYEAARLIIFPVRLPLLKSARPVLEAMAMGLPLVVTSAFLQCSVVKEALPGLTLGDHYVRADTAESFGALAARLLEIRSPWLHLSKKGRQYLEARSKNKE